MENNQEFMKPYIHCMQNCAVWQEFDSENTKPNVMKMGDLMHGF